MIRPRVSGARAFLSGLQELDQAEIVLFSDRTLLRSGFHPAANLPKEALGDVSAAGGTALNDQLYIALKQLEARQGRRVVILLSDGIDVHSVLRAADALWLSSRSQSIVYWIQLTDGRIEGVISAWRGREQHDVERRDLRRLVLDSGGRIVPIDDIARAPGVFAEILRELREQYVLGYYPTVDRDDGSWHPVRVRVARRGLTVRARRGYLDSP